MPQPREEAGERADPEHSGKSKAESGIQTDISPIIERVAAVVPVAQVPHRVKKPSDQKFQSGADEQREQERPDRVVSCDTGKKDIEKNAAHAVDRQPRTIEKAAVSEGAVL